MFLAIFFHFFLGSGSAWGWTEPNFQVQVLPLAKPNWTVASVVWSTMNYVKDQDIKAATVLPEVGLDEVEDLPEDWDAIYV